MVVAATDRRRRSGAPSGRRAARGGASWRFGAPLRERIATELRLGRSPVAIRSDLVAEDAPGRPCVETIYQAIYDGALGVRPSECLRSRRRRRRPRQCRRSTRRPTPANISRRPDAVNDRREGGHWEGDQIIGANNRSSMIWLTERQSRYLIPVTMPDGYTAAALAGLIEGFDTIPDRLRRSVTFDQGPEWANWSTLAAHYSIDVWFCDPHSPRQRGQIDNLNRQAR